MFGSDKHMRIAEADIPPTALFGAGDNLSGCVLRFSHVAGDAEHFDAANRRRHQLTRAAIARRVAPRYDVETLTDVLAHRLHGLGHQYVVCRRRTAGTV